jgi:phosphoribosylformylglycinamidine cyclo-ligase
MYRTFNMGVGFVLIIGRDHVDTALENLRSSELKAWEIGEIVSRPDTGEGVVFR